ncbi:MAG: extracellular solute-binding protein [Dictyoglomi bacterium]|nr:extracellular solute-binding protein [Dictyoglomota bacterium]
MKKFTVMVLVLSLVMSVLVFVSAPSSTYAADKKMIELFIGKKNVLINGKSGTQMDVAPVITNNRTFVPLRFVSEVLGAKVDWDAKEQKVIITMPGKTIELWPVTAKSKGKNTIRINGKDKKMDVKPYVDKKANRTLVPVRFVSEALGFAVRWDPQAYRVIIANFDLSIKANTDVSGEIVIWHGWGTDSTEAEILDEIIDRFQEMYPYVTVDQVSVPFNDLKNKLTMAIPQGQGPDLFIGPHDWVGELADYYKVIEPIDKYIDPLKLRAYFVPVTLQADTYKGHLWALPESFESVALIVNKDLINKVPTTREELLNAKSLVKDGVQPLVFPVTTFYFYAPFHFGFGGGIFAYKNGKLTVDPIKNEGAIQAMNYLLQLKKNGVLPQDPPDYSMMMDSFTKGKAAMIINGPWAWGDIKKKVPSASIELIPGGKPFVGVKNIYMSSESQNKEAALEFMKFFTGLVTDEDGYNAPYRLAKEVGHIPALVDLYMKSDIRNDEVIKGFSAQAALGIPMPNIPEMGSVWGEMDSALQLVYTGQQTPKQALESAYEKIMAKINK